MTRRKKKKHCIQLADQLKNRWKCDILEQNEKIFEENDIKLETMKEIQEQNDKMLQREFLQERYHDKWSQKAKELLQIYKDIEFKRQECKIDVILESEVTNIELLKLFEKKDLIREQEQKLSRMVLEPTIKYAKEHGLEMMEARKPFKEHILMIMEKSKKYAQENLEPYEMEEVEKLMHEKPTEARAIMSIVHSDTKKPQVTKVILQCNATKDIGNQEWMLPQMLQMEDQIHQKAVGTYEPSLCKAQVSQVCSNLDDVPLEVGQDVKQVLEIGLHEKIDSARYRIQEEENVNPEEEKNNQVVTSTESKENAKTFNIQMLKFLEDKHYIEAKVVEVNKQREKCLTNFDFKRSSKLDCMNLNSYLEDKYTQLIDLQEISHKLTLEAEGVIEKRAQDCKKQATVTVAEVPIGTTEEISSKEYHPPFKEIPKYWVHEDNAFNKAGTMESVNIVEPELYSNVNLSVDGKAERKVKPDPARIAVNRLGFILVMDEKYMKKVKFKKLHSISWDKEKLKKQKIWPKDMDHEYDPHVKFKNNTHKDGEMPKIIGKMLTSIEPG